MLSITPKYLAKSFTITDNFEQETQFQFPQKAIYNFPPLGDEVYTPKVPENDII